MPSNPTDPAVEAAALASKRCVRCGMLPHDHPLTNCAEWIGALPPSDLVSREEAKRAVDETCMVACAPGCRTCRRTKERIGALPSVPLAGGAGRVELSAHDDAAISFAQAWIEADSLEELLPFQREWEQQYRQRIALRAPACDCGKSMQACAETEDCDNQSMPGPAPAEEGSK